MTTQGTAWEPIELTDAELDVVAGGQSPNQIPIGTPISLLFIGAALIFIPTVFKVGAPTVFKVGAQVGAIPVGAVQVGAVQVGASPVKNVGQTG